MKLLSILVLASVLPLAAMAQGTARAADGTGVSDPPASDAMQALPEDVGPEAVEDEVAGLLVLGAAEADIDSFLWQMRPLLIFANTPADPAFQQQLSEVLDNAAQFVERDVVIITDTDPASGSSARQRLRPRGFMMAIIGKDGEIKQRRPAPRSAREITAVIDKFPLRRQEMLDERPSGRN